jgi:signal recognition particle subunit SRP54
LALNLKRGGRNPLLVAADLVRPAAVEQLDVLARKSGVEIYKEPGEKDPIKVVRHSLKHGARAGSDVLLIDTSGRLQIDEELMKEIEAIRKAADPDEVLLVADAMTGQSAVDSAKAFDERLGLTGVILSKFDSDARGGAALSIKSVTGKPIKYIGTGEQLDALEAFYPDRMASRILGMGDVVSLVEKAGETIREQEAIELQEKIASKTFTFEDFLDQIKRMRKMGSIKNLLEMIPGAQANIPEERINEKEISKNEAIILSMTRAERRNHRIIGPSRRKRIARGSGTAVYEVNKLIKQFEKTRLMMRKLTKNKKYQSNLLSQFGM